MKTSFVCSSLALSIVLIPLAGSLPAQSFTPEQILQRAIESVIWGTPAVNYERMLQAAQENGEKLDQVVYWSRLVNERNQSLTPPRPDTIYLNPFSSAMKPGKPPILRR
jgi:hypothetical protein